MQVPLLADGTVNLEEIFSGFHLSFPVHEDGAQSSQFTGKLLNEPFAGRVIKAESLHDFTLAIEAPRLSEHGNFLIAVLATDAICVRNGLRPGIVLWQDTKKRIGATWQVSTYCAATPN